MGKWWEAMVKIDLRKTEPEDVHLIRELQSYGLPDSLIQLAYDETIRRREEGTDNDGT